MMNIILILLFVGVVFTVIGELYYYGKFDFFTKTFGVVFIVMGMAHVTGLNDVVLDQLDKDMKTTTYYPVVNAGDY